MNSLRRPWLQVIALTSLSLAPWRADLHAEPVKVSDTGYRSVKTKNEGLVQYRRITLNTGAASYSFTLRLDSIGMRRPVGYNYYSEKFFEIQVGKEKFFSQSKLITAANEKTALRPKVVKDGDAVEIVTTQQGQNATARVRLRANPGETCIRMFVKVTPKGEAAPIRLQLVAYPSGFIRKGARKVVTFSSGRKIENRQGVPFQTHQPIQPAERWLYACDISKKGAEKSGGVGLVWLPEQAAKASLYLGCYAMLPRFDLKPGVETEFTLYDLSASSQDDGLAFMKTLQGPGKAVQAK